MACQRPSGFRAPTLGSLDFLQGSFTSRPPRSQMSSSVRKTRKLAARQDQAIRIQKADRAPRVREKEGFVPSWCRCRTLPDSAAQPEAKEPLPSKLPRAQS